MTACATVADVLALTDNPRAMSLQAMRRVFGIGIDRARVVKQIACREARVRKLMRECGVTDHEAREWLRMQGIEA